MESEGFASPFSLDAIVLIGPFLKTCLVAKGCMDIDIPGNFTYHLGL